MAKGIITWVEGLKGISGIIIFFNHMRSCVWPESSHAAASDGQRYIIAYPFISLICAGNLAVRLYFVMSGFALAYRPLQLMEEDRNIVLYPRISRQLQSRLWRLLVPSAIAAFISLVMTWGGAFEYSKSVCAAFDETTPVSTGVPADLILYLQDTLVDMWVVGVHHFHNSLWCMKLLLVGSYLMYTLIVMRAEARHGVWLWWLIGGVLLTPTVARLQFARGGTDLAGFVFGGVIAFTMLKRTSDQEQTSTTVQSSWTTWFPSSLMWSMFLIASLFLGSYPHGRPDAPWCLWLFSFGRFVLNIDTPRQIMIWWLNVAAFLICLCICKLPTVQYALGLGPLQYLGKTSFAFFLLHPLILRSLGGYTLTWFDAIPGVNLDVSALMTIFVTLPLSLLASHYWSIYVENKLHALVEKHLILERKQESSQLLPK